MSCVELAATMLKVLCGVMNESVKAVYIFIQRIGVAKTAVSVYKSVGEVCPVQCTCSYANSKSNFDCSIGFGKAARRGEKQTDRQHILQPWRP